MKSVLVTGAGGFIGRTTIRQLLDRGFVVHAVTSKPSAQISPDLTIHHVDLLDPDVTRKLIEATKPSHLLHFAWYVEHGKFWNAPENLEWVKASFSLLQNFVANGGKRVVMAGTCFEYDGHAGLEKFSEIHTPIDPRSLYGESKHSLHLMVQEYCKQLEVSYAWGRVFFLFGAFESPDRFIPSVIRALLQNEEAKCSHGDQIRDFMLVDDVGKAFVDLLDSNVQGAVNIASGEPRRLKDIAKMIAEIIGRPDLLRLGALPSNPDEALCLVADTTRLQSEVGFIGQTDLRAGLEKTINWWKNALNTSRSK